MRNVKILWTVLFFTLIIVFAGCAPSVQELEVQILPSDRLVKKLEANRRKIKTFVGTGVINIESKELTAKGNFEITIKKPDTIKVSIYGPWGIDLAHILVTKNDFVFYDVMNSKAYQGAVNQNVIKGIFKVDLSFDNLIDAFAGSVNLTEKLRLDPTSYDIKDDNYAMIYADSLKKEKAIYDISTKNLSIKQFRLIRFPETLALQSTFSDFKMFDDVPLPYNVLVENKLMGQKIKIEYRNIVVNEEIDEVNVNIPSDVELIEW